MDMFLLLERFVPKYKVNAENGCWEWIGAIDRGGYGAINFEGKVRKAHRLSHELFKGPIPEDLHICHKCDNRKCVNPEHLFPGTRFDNMQDCVQKGRLHPGWTPGMKNGSSKLTDNDVRAIRADNRTLLEIGKTFNITEANASMIKLRKTWKHIA